MKFVIGFFLAIAIPFSVAWLVWIWFVSPFTPFFLNWPMWAGVCGTVIWGVVKFCIHGPKYPFDWQ